MNIKRIIIATIVLWIVGTVFSMLTCGWLFNSVYEIEPITWQSNETIMSGSNMIYSNLFGILRSLLFVLVFAIIYKGVPGNGVKKGVIYGLLIWLVSGFSGIVTMPLYMTIATTVVVYWVIQALVLAVINGLIVGKIYKENQAMPTQ